MKAIHFICDKEAIGWKNLRHDTGLFYSSGFWDVSKEDAQKLLGGWLYLHERKNEASGFGGKIVGFEPERLDGVAHEDRIVFRVETRLNARHQKWRGRAHGMAWTSGVVEADLPHEVA